MEKKEDLLENFKTAITSTVKSISNENDIEISFEGQSNDDSNLVINLPKIENINNKINFIKIRAYADSKALEIRYSDKEIFKSCAPKGGVAEKLYEI